MTDTPPNTLTPDVLRRTAALMRSIAGAATPGPWTAYDDENHWSLHQRDWPFQILKAPKRGTPYAEYWPDPEDAAQIVSWPPEPAAAFATVLDAAALEVELLPAGAGLSPLLVAACRAAEAFQLSQPRTPDDSAEIMARLESLKAARAVAAAGGEMSSRRTLEQLAAEQGVRPLTDIRHLAADEPMSADEADAFLAAIRDARTGGNDD